MISQLNPFPGNDALRCHETFSFMMSHPWEIGSATAERAGQGEVGGCTRRLQTAWPCLVPGRERSWSALGERSEMWDKSSEISKL